MNRVPGIAAFFLGSCLFAASLPTQNTAPRSWNPQAAANYLDQREVWWSTWPPAGRDHGTFCVSCHTTIPYALARPALRSALAQQGPSPAERGLIDNVTKRVRLWKEVGTFYGPRNDPSRGAEAVLNALILASFDVPTGRLSRDTRTAFDNMWALQLATGEQKGAWPWINLGEEPWEAKDSPYYGAALAAIAVGTAPGNYRATPAIQNSLKLLREYLVREGPRQSAIDQIFLLWAAAKLPGMIAPEQRKSVVSQVLSKQNADGGWSLSSLAWTWSGMSLHSLVHLWTRSDASPWEAKSDGVATGIIAFTLEQIGTPREDGHLQRALSWLTRNQNPSDGAWPGYSLNTHRDPSSDIGRFMSDAATAFSVLALASDNLSDSLDSAR